LRRCRNGCKSTTRPSEDGMTADRRRDRALRARLARAERSPRLPARARRCDRRRRGACRSCRSRAASAARPPSEVEGPRAIRRAASTGGTARSTASSAAAAAGRRPRARRAPRWRRHLDRHLPQPADGKDYAIWYNDCCGRGFCGRCFCNRNEGDRPSTTRIAATTSTGAPARLADVPLLDRARDRAREEGQPRNDRGRGSRYGAVACCSRSAPCRRSDDDGAPHDYL
jgi:hypothetical protein